MAFTTAVDKQISTGSLISRFLGNLKKLGQDKLTLSVYETRLELLENYWTKFQDRHEELVGQKEYSSSDYAQNDIFFQTQESYLTVKAYIRERIRELSADTDTSRSDSGKLIVPQVRLPKISLPTFSGNYLEWESFRDLFTSLVHETPDLTNAVRLQYLKSSVTGEAAKLISGISITDANYEGAWRVLVQRYDNKKIILSHHFNHLLSLKAINTESAANLKHLLDTTAECRRAMQNLGRPVQYWDDWFVHLTVQKLDYSSRKDWETTRGITKDIPTYTELVNFLDSRIRALESVPSPFTPTDRSKNRNFAPPNVRSHATVMQTSGSSKVDPTCDLCGGKHYLGYCPEFKDKTPLQRKDIVIRLKRCFNCLKKHTNSCPSPHKCFICQDEHHTLLHVDDNPALTPAVQSISSAHAHMQPKRPKTSTLLATAIIRVTAPNGNFSLIRALLDQGSEATFISEDLTQRLHLQRTKVHIPVTGLGATRCGTVKALVSIQLSSTYKDYSSTVNAEAHVLPHLTKTCQPRRINTQSWPHLKALTLSDPGSSSLSKIDLVIGADLYGQILLDGLMKGPPGTPVAQHTIFGWVLSGQVKDVSPDCRSTEVAAFHCSLDLAPTQESMKFWEIEEVNQRPHLTPEEVQCEEHFQATHSRGSDGRFMVRLPRRSNVPLGDSRFSAMRSFQRNELRRLKDASLNQAYQLFMKEYLELGHMAVVSATSKPVDESFYLPHHAVWKSEGSSSKIRVVFNASARTSSGFSLNDGLLPGPKLHQLALDEMDKFPEAARVLQTQTYVDDILFGAETRERALELKTQLEGLVMAGGFQLAKWSSNCPELSGNDNLPPSRWCLGRVTQVHPGNDGIVRVATIRTATSELRRPVVKLCRLPAS